MSVNDHYIKSARRYLAEEDMDRAKELYERLSARSVCEDEARIAVLLCEYWEVRLTGYSKNYLPKGKELYEAVNNTGPLDIEFETLFPLLIMKPLDMPNKLWQLNLTVSGVTDYDWLYLVRRRLKNAADSDDFASINESRRKDIMKTLSEIDKKHSEAVSYLLPSYIQESGSESESAAKAHEPASDAKPRALHSDKNNKLDKARSCLRQHDFGKAAALYERFLDENDELAAAEAEFVLNYIEYRKLRQTGDVELMIGSCAALTESIIFYADNCKIDRDFASIIAELAVNLFNIPFEYSFSNMRKSSRCQRGPFFRLNTKELFGSETYYPFFEYKLPKAFAYLITKVLFRKRKILQYPLEPWQLDLCVAIKDIDKRTKYAVRYQYSDLVLADFDAYSSFRKNIDIIFFILEEYGLYKKPALHQDIEVVPFILFILAIAGFFFIMNEVFK